MYTGYSLRKTRMKSGNTENIEKIIIGHNLPSVFHIKNINNLYYVCYLGNNILCVTLATSAAVLNFCTSIFFTSICLIIVCIFSSFSSRSSQELEERENDKALSNVVILFMFYYVEYLMIMIGL